MIKTSALMATWVVWVAACLVSGTSSARAEVQETHPGISLEPMYSEAVIAFNAKQPAEALKILDAILKVKADYSQALELKALVLKGMGNPNESRKTYEALLKTTTDKTKAAPYHFELGVIDYNAKRLDPAAGHLKESAAQDFNADASHFFLGLIYFAQAERAGRLIESEAEFDQVAEGKTAELKPAAHYYKALIAYKRGFGSDGTHEMMEARDLARSMPDNAIAKDIDKAVGAALAPYAKGQLFGNLSLMAGYNDNIANLPVSAISVPQGSGQSTAQVLGVLGLGWMSSPLGFLQYVVSYRGSGNINFNRDTTAYEYLAHTGSVYLTRNALARTQYGLKLEGTWTFNNALNADTGNKAFSPFSLGGEFGPYLRHELSRGQQLTFEGYYRPQKFSQDSYADVSGNNLVVRSSLQINQSAIWWNPIYTVGLIRNNTQGGNFRSWGTELNLTDMIRPNDRNTISLTAGLNVYLYPDADPRRFDKLMILRAGWIRQFGIHWTGILDLGYQSNFSSVPDIYHYNQLSMSGGAGYNF